MNENYINDINKVFGAKTIKKSPFIEDIKKNPENFPDKQINRN